MTIKQHLRWSNNQTIIIPPPQKKKDSSRYLHSSISDAHELVRAGSAREQCYLPYYRQIVSSPDPYPQPTTPTGAAAKSRDRNERNLCIPKPPHYTKQNPPPIICISPEVRGQTNFAVGMLTFCAASY